MVPAVAAIPTFRAVSRVVTSRKVRIGRQVWLHIVAIPAVPAVQKNQPPKPQECQ